PGADVKAPPGVAAVARALLPVFRGPATGSVEAAFDEAARAAHGVADPVLRSQLVNLLARLALRRGLFAGAARLSVAAWRTASETVDPYERYHAVLAVAGSVFQ